MYVTNKETGFCSCPSWKFQRKPTNARICKHLKLAGYVVPTQIETTWESKRPKPRLMLAGSNRRLIQDGWLGSEKLDGVRGYWTGSEMLSRSGLVIDIPDRIRETMTVQAVDGEFFIDRNRLPEVIVATQSNRLSRRWVGVEFYVFDIHCGGTFLQRYQTIIRTYSYVCRHTAIQTRDVEAYLRSIQARGGEGIIMRDPIGLYVPGRNVHSVIKIKPESFGIARYDGLNTFSELFVTVPCTFKIAVGSKHMIRKGDHVRFRYNDRTVHHKPKYPKLCSQHYHVARS